MAIQKQFVLRHRSDGYLRFQVPARACETVPAGLLVERIVAIDGVDSARLYRGQQKLAIRYQSGRCRFEVLARNLFDILAELERDGHFADRTPAVTVSKSLVDRFRLGGIGRWFEEKYQAARETAQAAQVLGKLGSQGPKALFKDPEKAVTDFLNDVLILYLIRVHWVRITQHWLVRPWVYRYEWLAVFYLFYLLVRSRRKK